ncbi:MAG: acyl-CoA dehydratase activase [Thermodesulfobacteriota bacterium]
MQYYAGIDIGSTSIKIVLIDEQEHPAASFICPTGSHFYKNTRAAMDTLLERENIEHDQIRSIFSTGYGRKLFKEADDSISEITANGVGAAKIGEHTGQVRTIINIGGQDLKIISLDEDGHVKNFVMNDKCAAGTGRFLEMTSRNLEVEVDELGDYHRSSTGIPLTINSTCTVFAESEIIGLLANGHGKSEIIAGIHYSIARRVARLVKRCGQAEDVVLFDGGPAMNQGLVTAIEDELMRNVLIPESPQTTTAFGAALIARDSCMYEGEELAHV